MLKPEVVDALKQLLPPEMHKRAIVAGGYAAVPEKAADVDLWVIGGDMEMDYNRIRLHNHLGLMPLDSSPYEQFSNEFAVVTEQTVELKLGRFSTTYLPVQILVSSAPTFQDLVDRFDISIHAIGRRLVDEGPEGDDYPVYGKGFTLPHQQPRVLVFTRPEQTIRRLERILPRYGFEPHPDDLTRLGAAIAKANVGFEEVPF